MSSIIVAGDVSGSVTLQAPSAAGTTTLTLPSTSGTVIYSDASENIKFNSGYGSVATAYGCRAWVNFNGTGTVAIRASGNVSSITDNNVGDYTINFTNSIVDNNYAIMQGVNDDPGNYGITIFTEQSNGSSYGTKTTTSSVRIRTGQNLGAGAYADCGVINIGIFR